MFSNNPPATWSNAHCMPKPKHYSEPDGFLISDPVEQSIHTLSVCASSVNADRIIIIHDVALYYKYSKQVAEMCQLAFVHVCRTKPELRMAETYAEAQCLIMEGWRP